MEKYGQLIIDNLQILGSLGAYQEEHNRPRPYIVTAHLGYDIAQASASDDLGHALDYAELAKDWVGLGQSRHWNLLETLAVALLDLGFSRYPGLLHCQLSIKKTDAIGPSCHSGIIIKAKRFGKTWRSLR